MGNRISKQLSQRAVDGVRYDDAAEELGFDLFQARKVGKRIAVWDSRLPGFGLWLMPSGHKSFALHYKVGGKSRKLTIGNAHKVTATRARELAQEALQAIKDGADPQSEKRRQESAQTVAQVFDAFIKQPKRDGAPRAAATIEDYHRNFERFIEPYIGSTLVSSVGQADCNRIIEAAREGEGPWSPRATARPRRSTPPHDAGQPGSRLIASGASFCA